VLATGIGVALGGVAVFKAVWLVAVAPGATSVAPSSRGWEAYQPTALIRATAARPATIAPAGTPRRRDVARSGEAAWAASTASAAYAERDSPASSAGSRIGRSAAARRLRRFLVSRSHIGVGANMTPSLWAGTKRSEVLKSTGI
jgi:hypothetical protein